MSLTFRLLRNPRHHALCAVLWFTLGSNGTMFLQTLYLLPAQWTLVQNAPWLTQPTFSTFSCGVGSDSCVGCTSCFAKNLIDVIHSPVVFVLRQTVNVKDRKKEVTLEEREN